MCHVFPFSRLTDLLFTWNYLIIIIIMTVYYIIICIQVLIYCDHTFLIIIILLWSSNIFYNNSYSLYTHCNHNNWCVYHRNKITKYIFSFIRGTIIFQPRFFFYIYFSKVPNLNYFHLNIFTLKWKHYDW